MEPPETPGPPRERVRVRKRRHRRPWWRRRPAQRVFLGLTALGFLLVLDGAWAATSALGNLSSARRLLVEAESDLAAGNLDLAIRRFVVDVRILRKGSTGCSPVRNVRPIGRRSF
ncbi:MAG: hypothetical protein ACREA0_00840 [bacterium]